MTIAIGISEIVIQSVRDSRQLIDRTTAWYRAESGIETALDQITQNAPGFQKPGELVTADGKKLYSYEIVAASDVVPAKPYENAPPEESYSDLPLGQTVNIPLFSAAEQAEGQENQETVGVDEFKLFYYLDAKFELQGAVKSDDLDVIRWKIFGINKITKENEVINGLIPIKKESEDQGLSVSCLGTANEHNCFSIGRFSEKNAEGDTLKFDDAPIQTFMQNHTRNFLAITNMINIDMISGPGPNEKKELSTIKYKLVQLGPTSSTDKRLTLPTIKVTADGFEKNTKQSIDIEISRERSLPVFNYALYKTK